MASHGTSVPVVFSAVTFCSCYTPAPVSVVPFPAVRPGRRRCRRSTL